MIHDSSLLPNIVSKEIRVTRVLITSDKDALFAGRPTKEAELIDAKTIIRVKVASEKLGGVPPTVGEHWRVTGDLQFLQKDEYYNSIFIMDATSCECQIPSDNEAMIRFMATQRDFVSVGEKLARRFCNKYFEKAFEVGLYKSTEEIMEETGLTERAVMGIKKGFTKYSNLKNAKWLSNNGVPLSIIMRIIKFHGQEIMKVIGNNPYRLMDFGLSFNDSDAVAKRLLCKDGKRLSIPDFNVDKRRLLALIDHAMFLNSKRGHTTATASVIKAKLSKIPSVNVKHIEGSINLAVIEKKLIKLDDNRYASTGVYIMEATIAKRFSKLAKIERWGIHEEKAFEIARQQYPFPLSDNQLLAIRRSVLHGISVITGGAGTGKTTVLNGVLKAYAELGYEINGVAVAGRAARRMYQSTGRYTSTIAKYLRSNPPDHSKPYVLVIDEASMIDVITMFNIVTHLPDTARIILVGDVQQLPPIGAGRVFSDVIYSNVIPTTILTINERQDASTGIPEYSNQIIAGEMPEELTTGNIRFHNTRIEDIENTVVDIIKRTPNLPQVLGMTRKGYQSQAGLDNINNAVQCSFNFDSKRIETNDSGFYSFLNIKQKDRVMFVRNNYDKDVWNGTLGTVTNVEINEGSYALVQTDDGEIVNIDYSIIFDMQLSYAISVHKAQGSQFPHIIITLTNSSMSNRSWLYTAITRAEAYVDIVGPLHLFEKAVRTAGEETTRQTYLKELLLKSVESKRCIVPT